MVAEKGIGCFPVTKSTKRDLFFRFPRTGQPQQPIPQHGNCGGFTGIMLGLFATSAADTSKAEAEFDYFDYSTKKGCASDGRTPLSFFLVSERRLNLFSRVNCLRRANTCTSTTLCASFRIDMILITFRNSAYRTLVDASSASNAVVTNYVSHFFLILKLLLVLNWMVQM